MADNQNLVHLVIDAIKAPIVGAGQGFVTSAQLIRSALPSSGGQSGLILLLILTAAILIGLKLSGSLVF